MKISINSNYYIYFTLMFLGVSGFLFTLFMSSPEGFYAFVSALGLAGLGVATYIYITKRKGGDLVCPTGSNCNVVVNSKFAKFLHIPLENLGLLYYATIAVLYAWLVFNWGSVSDLWLFWIVIFTAGAFLFSCYLLFVQAFLLRAWCIWCLLSSMLSMAIFIFSLVSIPEAITFLGDMSNVIDALKTLGFVLGAGSSTAAAFLFFRFLKDFDIDDEEMGALQSISEIAWLGLALALMSQLAAFVANADILTGSSVFIVQTLALFAVAVSGAILMIIFAPFIVIIPFKKKEGEESNPSVLASLRRPIFVNGAIALSSWYFAFSLEYIGEYSIGMLAVAYAIFVSVGIIFAIAWQKAVSSGKLF